MILRICFTKGDSLRFVSHLQVMNAMNRTLRRAQVPFSFTKGFHPRPKISMGPPLPVGITSEGEYLDVEIEEEISKDAFSSLFQKALPQGFTLVKVGQIEEGIPSLMALLDTASYWIPFTISSGLDWDKRFGALLEESDLSSLRIKKGKKKRVQLKPLIRGYTLNLLHSQLEVSFYVRVGSKGNVRPEELLQLIPSLMEGLVSPPLTQVKRRGLYFEKEGSFIPPL